jgi:hypothetical protein
MIRVFHLTSDAPRDDMLRVTLPFGDDDTARPKLARQLLDRGAYEIVAVLPACTELEVAWRLTNNIDSSWSLEPATGVHPVMAPGANRGRRSSMVGDVFELNGKVLVVDTFGFTALPDAEPEGDDPLGDWHGRNE